MVAILCLKGLSIIDDTYEDVEYLYETDEIIRDNLYNTLDSLGEYFSNMPFDQVRNILVKQIIPKYRSDINNEFDKINSSFDFDIYLLIDDMIGISVDNNACTILSNDSGYIDPDYMYDIQQIIGGNVNQLCEKNNIRSITDNFILIFVDVIDRFSPISYIKQDKDHNIKYLTRYSFDD